LAIGYGRASDVRTIASDLTVSLRSGEFACLLGPNGAGKSTLLRSLTGLQRPLTGHATLCGVDIAHLDPRARARQLAVVLTDRVGIGLLPVRGVVAMGRHPYTDWRGRLRAEDERAVDAALEAVGASPLSARLVSELSDGERQRVMVARALAQEPQVLVLDEVTAFLDLPRRIEMMVLLRRLSHERGLAVLCSTHDLDLALRHADTLWVMTPGGHLHHGWPEALVLQGTLQQVFGHEQLQFDLRRGEFVLPRTPGPPVHIDGTSPAAVWTARAFERHGFSLDVDATSTEAWRVEVHDDDRQPRWIARHGSHTACPFDSLEACVDFVAAQR